MEVLAPLLARLGRAAGAPQGQGQVQQGQQAAPADAAAAAPPQAPVQAPAPRRLPLRTSSATRNLLMEVQLLVVGFFASLLPGWQPLEYTPMVAAAAGGDGVGHLHAE